MKKIIFAASFLSLGFSMVSCGGAHGDNPGHSYMPDMYYSRAYEAYNYNNVGGELDTLRKRGIRYTELPVPGTVAREDMLPDHIGEADTAAAHAVKNPMGSKQDDAVAMKDAERLYLINCAICHGPQLDGNGPLYKGGEGPYPAAPRPLNGDYAKNLTDGSMYHTITFGKGAMGSYASQLRPEQRWLVIDYIRKMEGVAENGAAEESTNAAITAGDQGTKTTQQP